MTAEGLFLNAQIHRTVEAGSVVYEEGETGTSHVRDRLWGGRAAQG